jgi:hypothetical protein
MGNEGSLHLVSGALNLIEVVMLYLVVHSLKEGATIYAALFLLIFSLDIL